MFINFGLDIEEYTFEVQLGNAIIQNQTVQMPSIMAQQNYMQLVEQIANDKRPMQVKCSKIEYTDNDKQLSQYIIFQNNTFAKENNEGESNGFKTTYDEFI